MQEAWIRELTDRVRALGPVAATTMPAPVPDLAGLGRELDALEVRYAEHAAELVVETRRRVADLEEIHAANRLVTVATLTAGMAHELGTPLGVVLARAQMIIADDRDIVEAREDAVEIVAQVKRMTQMCREVLDYARPHEPIKIAVDVVALARQAVALLVADARKRNVRLAFVNGPPSEVHGDASKLLQILTNLIINAAQAIPHGGVVTVGVTRGPIEPPSVAGLPAGDYVAIAVTDTGTGIRSADLAHVFDTFFTTKKPGEGTGLGLAVSYRIAREHGGWIAVATEEGAGSTFTVYLPPDSTSRAGGTATAD